jgi:hypothetical protein
VPQGTIEVRNMFGSLVVTSTLPLRNVWPADVRNITASVGNGLWLGRYTIFFRAKYGDVGQELYSQERIWVVPWRTQGWKVLLGISVFAFCDLEAAELWQSLLRPANGEAASRRLLINFDCV